MMNSPEKFGLAVPCRRVKYLILVVPQEGTKNPAKAPGVP